MCVTKLDLSLVPLSQKITISFLFMFVVGCGGAAQSALTQPPKPTPVVSTPTATFQSTEVFTPISASTVTFTCNTDWQSMPVIPVVTEFARETYQQGLAEGNDAHAFSKIGDGEISTTWFLTDFDLGENYYNLGEYQNLSTVIEYFHGSFERISLAARSGFNTNLILDSSVSDQTLCTSDESSLECELRVHNPSIAMLSLGTNQVHRPAEFEAGMREIINVLLSNHVLPILSTKGDNLEGDHRINRMIGCLAQEYQIPLWNFWAAIQPLPNHGLQPDLEHLTYYGNSDFSDPLALESAWAVRNLTTLQVLDAVWRGVTK
jgi:hypothetical protein